MTLATSHLHTQHHHLGANFKKYVQLSFSMNNCKLFLAKKNARLKLQRVLYQFKLI